LGYSENYTKVTPGYIQLLNGTFNTTISADGTLNGSPILTEGVANGLYYPASGNPSGFITSSALAPYLTTSTASSTYFTIASAASKANLASPTFTGSPSLPTGTTAVTQTSTTNNTSIATTAFVQTLSNVKAFVSFNGTGTISIAAQKNIMSITDNGVGDYTLNFVSSVNAGYSAVFGAPTATDNTKGAVCIHGGYNSAVTTKSTTALRIAAGSANSLTAVDFQDINVAIIR